MVGAMLRSASTEREFIARPENFDTDPFLMNVVNGTIDLRTGKLRDHRRDDYMTKMANVLYDPSAACPKFEEFLLRIMGGKQSLVTFLQRWLGYCLTGDVSEQAFAVFFGDGANGKSTLTKTISAIMGDYYKALPAESLMAPSRGMHQSGAATPDLAALDGRRFVCASEPEKGRALHEGLLKQVASDNETTRARALYRDPFDLKVTFKIVLTTNHKPRVRGTDLAIWRRIKLVPFMVTIPEAERILRYHEILLKERSGILNWLIRGCLDWQKDRLDIPVEVEEATAAYKEEQDPVGRFWKECIEPSTENLAKEMVYRVYEWWCNQNDESTKSKADFSKEIIRRGALTTRLVTSGRKVSFWTKIAIRPEVWEEFRAEKGEQMELNLDPVEGQG
jgi:putative DNA primase/helicase